MLGCALAPTPVLVACLILASAALTAILPSGLAATVRRAQSNAGYSLSLNGSNSSVTAIDSPSLRIETANAFTVTFWVALRQLDNNVLPRFWEKGGDFLCLMGDRSNPRFGEIGLEVANASGGGNANGGASEFWSKTRMQPGRWYFVAVTFSGDNP